MILSSLHKDSNYLVALATLKKTHIVMQKVVFSFFSDHSDVALHQCRTVKYYNR